MSFDLNAPAPDVYHESDELRNEHREKPFHYGDMIDLADQYINDHKRAIQLIFIEMKDGFLKHGVSWGDSVLDIATGYGWCPSEVLPAARALASLGIIDLHTETTECSCDACVAKASWISLSIDYSHIERVLWSRYARDVIEAQEEAHRITNSGRYQGGYVYLIKCGPRHKIGVTKSVPRRMEQLQGQSPFPIEVVHYVQGRRYMELERQLHEQYADHRVHGEWFVLDPDQVASVIEWMNDWQLEGAD